MLDTIDRTTIDTLLDTGSSPCVTILMPTQRSGRETQQGPIRLKNLVDEARRRLVDGGMRDPEASDLLSEVTSLVDDGSFWQHQEDGLAIYVSPDSTKTFRLAVPLDELVVVGDAFHLKPLLLAAEGDDRFHLLAVSRGRVRLLWGRRHRIGEVAIEGSIPDGLAEALWYEDREKQLQHRASDRAGRGSVVATFHGHGTPDEDEEERDRAFLRAVDRGVMELVDSDVPLVLAGVTEITAMYRDVTKHPNVVEEPIGGNPDEATPRSLHERAWAVVEPILSAQRARDAEQFREQPTRGTVDLEEALAAAGEGRVDAIWVPLGSQRWGTATEGTVDVHEERSDGDSDLFDLAALRTRATGGRVHVATDPDAIPGGGDIAALFRY